MADYSPEQLSQEIYQLDQQIKHLQSQVKEKKDALTAYVDNNKYNGSISNTFGTFKVTHKRNMNATVNKKELDKHLESGYNVPSNLIQTKQEIHKPTLAKMIEAQDDQLSVIASFVSVNYTNSVTVTKQKEED